MNLPNKLTMLRIFMTFIIIIILLFPFSAMGIDIPPLFINELLSVDIRYPIAGVLFILASLTDFVDGYIARSRNLITDFGKMMDAIADKILVNSKCSVSFLREGVPFSTTKPEHSRCANFKLTN